ncbi:MAG: hypothetical protein H6662_09570 [Ardenticatenaceae bacterium]|nr:hypothetical protein [Ardenticatenaceae bacterium]MCB8991021.1 hypothetical protein [Ardenticatenaceae bacterium]
MMFVRIIVGLTGLALVVMTVVAAVKTFVLPRGVNVWLTQTIFHGINKLFRLRAKKAKSYEEVDRVMAMYAPLALVMMPAVMLSLILLGYMGLFWALDMASVTAVFKLSGSSLLTLGYESGGTIWHKLLEFSEAMIGLIMVALLIAYLPTIYSAFAKRETAVALLEAYAGTPPSAQEMLLRVNRIGELKSLREVWVLWQVWFAEIEESHTSLAPLSFFRSPQPDRSWITASGAVLDCAALVLSTVDIPWDANAAVCIRNGYIALRRIADFFGVAYNPHPTANDPISISRNEYDSLYDLLAAQNLPLKSDREQAWRDFAGWRVNYDTVLLRLASLTMAPFAPWSSDRSPLP